MKTLVETLSFSLLHAVAGAVELSGASGQPVSPMRLDRCNPAALRVLIALRSAPAETKIVTLFDRMIVIDPLAEFVVRMPLDRAAVIFDNMAIVIAMRELKIEWRTRDPVSR